MAVERSGLPPGYAAGAPLPWWGKVGVKLALAALRLPRDGLRRIGIGRHSFIADDPSRLLDEPAGHVARYRALTGRVPVSVLELGPGRMVARAPAYAALGCREVWFADVEDDAPQDVAAYARVAALAAGRGWAAPDLSAAKDRAAALAACGARLLIGPEALAAIPAGSVDLIISDVALEHVRRAALPGLLAELRRISAPGALGRHAVDFHDHVGAGLNTLRFSPQFWEGEWVGRSGLYVNRLGLGALLGAFARAGFPVTSVTEALAWPAPPPGAAHIHPELRDTPAGDLIAFARIETRLPA
ncbi:hypothetical protein C8P66_13927 [Humitalea rosea]|uniref:Methyltransferase family protein n=1 Tax=Humitalea rosea TaxID=990373 RepID=A0A2W7HWX5_9PROT|nr:hypothetical protein [Humitalea rosea]PZW37875.1 hypothetical protein C8P66_13927 [Humitalea rosea]